MAPTQKLSVLSYITFFIARLKLATAKTRKKREMIREWISLELANIECVKTISV